MNFEDVKGIIQRNASSVMDNGLSGKRYILKPEKSSRDEILRALNYARDIRRVTGTEEEFGVLYEALDGSEIAVFREDTPRGIEYNVTVND